jgi:hypothetical protein
MTIDLPFTFRCVFLAELLGISFSAPLPWAVSRRHHVTEFSAQSEPCADAGVASGKRRGPAASTQIRNVASPWEPSHLQKLLNFPLFQFHANRAHA